MELCETDRPFERMLMDKANAACLPFSGAMELSPVCNMRCGMCYVRRDENEAGGKILRAAEWLRIGESAKEAGVLYILLTGGEPLLHPDFKEIYLGLKEMGLVINLNTNGTLLDEKWADFFAGNPCRRIKITLYGASRETYACLCRNPDGFEKTMRAFKLLKERDLPVRVNLSVTRENRGELSEMLEIVRDMGLTYDMSFYMYPSGRGGSKEEFEGSRMSPEEMAETKAEYVFLKGPGESRQEKARIYLDPIMYPPQLGPLAKGFPCSAGRCGFWIDWQGHLSSCAFIPEPGADLKEVSFKEGWEKIVGEVGQIETCRDCHNCRMRIMCDTCAAAMYAETGSFSGRPQYLCDVMHETADLMLPYLTEKEAGKFRALL